MKNKTQTSKNSMELVDLCPLKNKLFVMNVKVEIPVKKKLLKCIAYFGYIHTRGPMRPRVASIFLLFSQAASRGRLFGVVATLSCVYMTQCLLEASRYLRPTLHE